MAYWMLNNDRAQYAIDWDIVLRIVRAHHRSTYRFQCARVTKASDSHWYNPMSWSLPEVQSVEVDWERIRPAVNRFGDADFARLAELATRDVREMERQLRWMVAETSRYTTLFLDLQMTTQSENMARINQSIDSYGHYAGVAKFLRDTSADGLMVGATVLTGGAGLALLSGASVLKGVGKFEDTDNLAAAVLYSTGNFVFGAFKLGGRGFDRLKEEAVVVILQAQWEAGVALAEGKPLLRAVETGGLKLLGPFADRFFKMASVQSLIRRACIPVTVTNAPTVLGKSFAGILGDVEQPLENLATKLATTMATKIMQKQGIEGGGKSLLVKLHEQGAVPRYSTSDGQFMESITFSDDTLLTWAIVNMEKGIGRGL